MSRSSKKLVIHKCGVCLQEKECSAETGTCYECLDSQRVFIPKICVACGCQNDVYDEMVVFLTEFHAANPNAYYNELYKCSNCPGSILSFCLPENHKCAICGVTKGYVDFGPTRSFNSTKYQCRDCTSSYHLHYKRSNISKIRGINYRSNQRNKDKVSARQWERVRIANNPDFLTGDQWQFALDYFNGCCAVCGRPPGLWHKIARDHWIPFSKGGKYTRFNIVPMCHATKDGWAGCNNQKSNKNPEEWILGKFGLKKGKKIINRINEYFAVVTGRTWKHVQQVDMAQAEV